MAPLSPWASPSPSPQYNSKNLRRGLLQEGVGASSSSAAWKRLGTNHLPPERSASFHGRSTNNASASTDPHQSKQLIRRPKTQPDLIAAAGGGPKNINTSSPTPGDLLRKGSSTNFATSREQQQQQMMMRKVPAKVLVNVNVQRSLGALQVMASTEWTVHQLVAAAVKQYVKEGRRPLLPSTDPSTFGLHYSQFSLECLDPEEKLIGLGSRTFFLCPKTTATAISASTLPAAGSASASSSSSSSSSSSCSKEAGRVSKITIPWLRFMDFLF